MGIEQGRHISNGTYRPEFDGLRALVVLVVMLFHVSMQRLSGGYLAEVELLQLL